MCKIHRQRLVSAVILSRIDYCNTIQAGLRDVSLLPLRWVMNAAARFVTDLGPRDHVSQTTRDLRWLPIRQRIDFKLGTMIHAIVHGTGIHAQQGYASYWPARPQPLTHDLLRVDCFMCRAYEHVMGHELSQLLVRLFGTVHHKPSGTLPLRDVSFKLQLKHVCSIGFTMYEWSWDTFKLVLIVNGLCSIL